MTKRLVGLCFQCEKPINNRRKDKSSTVGKLAGAHWYSTLCATCEQYAKEHNGALPYTDEQVAKLAEQCGMPAEEYGTWLRSQSAEA